MNKKEPPVTRGEIKAFLGEGTDFKGILTFEDTVRIDGKLDGEIYTKDTLIVGESAVVSAEINVNVIVISGTVRGNINATGKIEVHRPGKLFGNVKTPSLFIEEGVVFEGSCSMTQDPAVGKKVPSITAQPENEDEAEKKTAVKTD